VALLLQQLLSQLHQPIMEKQLRPWPRQLLQHILLQQEHTWLCTRDRPCYTPHAHTWRLVRQALLLPRAQMQATKRC
jgi:hypothetical protein